MEASGVGNYSDSSLVEIDDIDQSASDDADADNNDDGADYKIQVPSSSPHKRTTSNYSSGLDSSPPVKVTTKLPSLREQFAFNPAALADKKRVPSNMSTDYMELRKLFPKMNSSTIISALKTQTTLRNAIRYLKTLSGPDKSPSKSLTRLDTICHTRGEKLALSSSPIKPYSNAKMNGKNPIERDYKKERELRLKEKAKAIEMEKKKRERDSQLARKKAEKEAIVSSKVQLGSSKRSLKDRYVSASLSKNKTQLASDEEEEEEEEEEEHDESENDSIVELVDSDDSIEETIKPLTSRKNKRTYEHDDDYSPVAKLKIKRPALQKKVNERSDRAQRRAAVDDDFLLPNFKADEDADLNIDQKVVKLFNNADIRDIIDLSTMKPEQATKIVENRPYSSIREIKKVNLYMGKNPSKANNPIERFLDITEQKLSAYSAIDTLLKQCFDYSKSITSEIKKWGIDLKGKNLDGEIAITDVNVDTEESEDDDASDEEININVPTKKKKYKKFKIDGSEDDDSYSSSGKKKIYKSNLDNSNVRDKIGYFKKKPSLLADNITLKDYQQVGINWINLLFQKQLSCILADEMGLGKTAQVISFLSHLKQKKYPGPHLIVVPSSTLENWLREFEKFSPSLNVIPYYGSMDEREELRSVLYEDNDYDVIVTTYNLATGKIDAPFLQSLDFNAIVYDEGHVLKNATSDRYKKLTKLKANFRLLLTGTPLQNNLKELVSLLDFILPEIFNPRIKKLELLFDQKATTKTDQNTIEGENYNPLMSEQAISKAKVMMSPFVLRRTKAQVMKDLPQKHTLLEYCNLVPLQLKIYQDELNIVEDIRQEKARRKTLSESELKKLPPLSRKTTNILMTLRKACNHPLLFRTLYTDQMLKAISRLIRKHPTYAEANEQYIFEDLQVMSDFEITQLCHTYPNQLGKFVLKQNIYENAGKVKRLVELLVKIIEKGEKVLIFSMFTQMLDILEKVLSLHNWKFLRLDGATAVDTRQTIIDTFYEDKTIPIMLLSTKAGGFGINLVCASNVIIYDQSLNPHDDRQAEDRAHRVGQVKEVHITRLVTKDSIEENILHMAFNKLQLDNSMMAKNVEDVLLKTVEDLIASKKKEKMEDIKDQSVGVLPSVEPEETKFEAFETPLSLEMVNENGGDNGVADDNEITEVQSKDNKTVEANSKRTRRNRQKVNYFDGEIPGEFLEDTEKPKSKNINKNSNDDVQIVKGTNLGLVVEIDEKKDGAKITDEKIAPQKLVKTENKMQDFAKDNDLNGIARADDFKKENDPAYNVSTQEGLKDKNEAKAQLSAKDDNVTGNIKNPTKSVVSILSPSELSGVTSAQLVPKKEVPDAVDPKPVTNGSSTALDNVSGIKQIKTLDSYGNFLKSQDKFASNDQKGFNIVEEDQKNTASKICASQKQLAVDSSKRAENVKTESENN